MSNISLKEKHKLVMHVGLMKTATSTLQLQVFPNHRDLIYLGGPQFEHDVIRRAVADITKHDRLRFDPSLYRQEVRDIVSRVSKPDSRTVVSAESLTTPTIDRLTKAERIRDVFGPVEILVCLRRPEDFIVSLYSQYVKNLDPLIQRRQPMNDWLKFRWSHSRASSVARFLEFSRSIRAYQSVFDAEHVHVLLFEELSSNRSEFAQRLSRYIDIDAEQTELLLGGHKENVRLTRVENIQSELITNRYAKKVALTMKSMLPPVVGDVIKKRLAAPQQFDLTAEWKDKIRTYARKENNDLSDLIDLDVKRYDYY